MVRTRNATSWSSTPATKCWKIMIHSCFYVSQRSQRGYAPSSSWKRPCVKTSKPEHEEVRLRKSDFTTKDPANVEASELLHLERLDRFENNNFELQRSPKASADVLVRLRRQGQELLVHIELARILGEEGLAKLITRFDSLKVIKIWSTCSQ